MHYVVKLAALLCSALVIGCSTGTGPIPFSNPASAYCLESGGHLRIEQTKSGQVGICSLPDGREFEEWQLFRQPS